jgi:L-seryl-tRNA(Ser) seleniumtransferase
MLSTPMEALESRAQALAQKICAAAPAAKVTVAQGVGYLGSGSLPTEQLPSWTVHLELPNIKAAELARRLRMDQHAVFARIEDDQVIFDARTITDAQVEQIAGAVGRAVQT